MVYHDRVVPLTITLTLLLAVCGFGAAAASPSLRQHFRKPLRVFVLVGQSNMVGHGAITSMDNTTGLEKNATLEWLVANVPDQFGMLKRQKQKQKVVSNVPGDDEDEEFLEREGSQKSKWTVRPDVLMACNSRIDADFQPHVTEYDNLYAGLCAGDPGQYQLGPELGFGWSVGNAFFDTGTGTSTGTANNDNNILLLKIAWGGKSLAVDFRPPSSRNATGPYYESMIATVRNTLADDMAPIFPNESGRPVQLSGFAWHQGWNDGCTDWMADEYEHNLANLIRDVRTDLNVSQLPFAIASTGMGGYHGSEGPSPREQVIAGELKVATYPEFKGNVMSVDTRPFARDPAPVSPTGVGYHWMSNAESYWLVGKSLGEAMVGLVRSREEVMSNSKQERMSEFA